ncbi:hypothetical protein AMAG_00097 [Allomyces macrogynus ATCC 38327]|uniref:Uncharacterized protein n=1 Tax=Allomyces macrogynus (strain ATCC 38327) TaxID=578462 RepID=A0A0L0RVJ0_ALLM3|nr:hypothetical protein AMAG_00097 [Allomyces macrogynus ATCC 38327]|eukprot:KNE54095.1 hypothetical protein AMAG_00097 [Allomyces macrogynus ATCC 38327]
MTIFVKGLRGQTDTLYVMLTDSLNRVEGGYQLKFAGKQLQGEVSVVDAGICKDSMTRACIPPLIREYRRFLALKFVHRDADALLLSPSPLIDVVWHAHVLDTKSYVTMCAKLPFFIHHKPKGARDAESQIRDARRRKILACYRARLWELCGEKVSCPKDMLRLRFGMWELEPGESSVFEVWIKPHSTTFAAVRFQP